MNNNEDYNEYNNENYNEKENKKQKRGIGFLGAIAIALIFMFLGTTLGVYSAYNVIPETNYFSESKLGKEIMKNYDKENKQENPPIKREGMSIPEIVKLVQPAVVTVSVKVRTPGSIFNPQEGYAENIGTGFILNKEGYIATNYHVVGEASEVNVILYTGEEVLAKVINYDAQNDLAIIQIQEEIEVPGVVALGDSDNVNVGETVVAIGNPIAKEFAGTVTSGIVSALDRTVKIEGSEYQYIQTDAAINGGNSGGPLINSVGEVIGINSAKITSDYIEGIGFAIPINDLTSRIDTLSKAALYIGIAGREINEEISNQRDLPVGVLVAEVMDNSPAYMSGISVGDIIVEFDGQKVSSVIDINEIKNSKEKGDEVIVKIFRENKEIDLKLILDEK